jgi:XisI protein
MRFSLSTAINNLRCASGGYCSIAVEQYRQYIRQLLSERARRASIPSNAQEYEVQTVFDSEQDRYQLLYVGWLGDKRHMGCVLYVNIKDGKIWIQHDGTEEGLANRLVEMGVPKEDIVLAFHEPEIRQFTEFGTGEAIAI